MVWGFLVKMGQMRNSSLGLLGGLDWVREGGFKYRVAICVSFDGAVWSV